MTLRALLVVLLVALVAGTPGLGLETRTDGSVLVGSLYAIPFLGALGGLIASWRWLRASVWLSWIGAASAVLLSALDVLGLTDGRPPVAVAIVEVVAIVASLGILALTTRRLTRTA
jgi:hypothetical protein